MFAAQFAHAAGAKVIITSSSDDKINKVKRLGVDEGINYKKIPKWADEVKRLNNGVGVDHVIEVGGSTNWDISISSLRPNGFLHQIGFLGGQGSAPDIAGLLVRNKVTVRGVLVGSREMFQRMNSALERHKLKPVIDRVFEFEAAKEAYQYFEKQQHIGKVVIRVAKAAKNLVH